MSDKKRRDITLGEMQDECTRIGGICVGIKNITEDCKYLAVCPFQSAKRKMCALNLTDPPRFNDAQMAFWSGWRNAGATRAFWSSGNDIMCIMFMKDEIPLGSATVQYDFLGLEKSGFADLAELLGKDAT